MHVGTHHITIHQTLRELLEHDGWVIDKDYPPLSSVRTPFGWASFRDGVLTARNPRFHVGLDA